MSKNLSPEARYRLWQCYLLLLKLADEIEKQSATADVESLETQGVAEADPNVEPADQSGEMDEALEPQLPVVDSLTQGPTDYPTQNNAVTT